MKFNGKKSKVIVVRKGGRGLKLYIDGEELEVVEAFRYLGVWVDEKLRVNVYLEEIKVKAEKWIGKFVWMSKVNGKMEVDRDRMPWELLARPRLEHATEVWLTGGLTARRKWIEVGCHGSCWLGQDWCMLLKFG